MRPTLSQLKHDLPLAFESLYEQLNLGTKSKRLLVSLLLRIPPVPFLYIIPGISKVFKLLDSLVYGHITLAKDMTDLKSHLPIQTALNRKLSTVDQFLSMSNGVLWDYVVIGSGPGATIAVKELLEKGPNLHIAVLERGNAPKTPTSMLHSLRHVINDFWQGGQELIVNLNLPQFAQGNVFGGGSEVNSGLYHKLPKHLTDKYSQSFGIDQPTWDKAESEVEDFLKPAPMSVEENDSIVALGGRALGLEVQNIPRWRSYDLSGQFTQHSMNELFWSKLSKSNPNICLVEGASAQRFQVQSDGLVKVIFSSPDKKNKFSITAKNLIVSGGPISTPELLARSSLIRWAHTRFSWHPMIRVIAKVDENILGGVDIDPFQSWTKDKSLKIGSAVSTPSLLAINLGRLLEDGEKINLRSYYVSFPSTGRGGIFPYTSIPWYKNSKLDNVRAKEGLALLKDLISRGGGKILNEASLNPKKQSTVHVFGTLPINSRCYIPGTTRLKKAPMVQVLDSSIIPFPPGVNPQAVAMTCALISLRKNGQFHED